MTLREQLDEAQKNMQQAYESYYSSGDMTELHRAKKLEYQRNQLREDYLHGN